MTSIFENDAAFDPMFDDSVSIEAARTSDTVRGTFAACVMPIEDDEPCDPSVTVQSDRPRFSVLIPSRGSNAWLESVLGTRPRIGDFVTLRDGMKTSVVKVNPTVGTWFELEVRKC